MLRFRNIDVSPSDPVETWSVEGLLTAIERGGIMDWRRVVAEVRADPAGEVALDLAEALELAEPSGAKQLLTHALAAAKQPLRGL